MDLFAGIGGFSLGLKLAFGDEYRTVCYVENDDYCLQVLTARIGDGFLDDAPIWDDISTFEGEPWHGCVDIITAGFPCQPWSMAGKREGETDERNLWPELRRVIGEVEPRYVLLENVPALLSYQYFGTILGELAESGFNTKWDCLPASAIGANHQRDRLWIMGYSEFCGCCGKSRRRTGTELEDGHLELETGNVADSDGAGQEIFSGGEGWAERSRIGAFNRTRWWDAEPNVGRVANGVPDRVGKLRAFGGAIVPGVAAEFLRRIADAD